MFEEIKHSKVFVMWLARSGTRICARMIAEDTGLEFIDETEWGIIDIPKLKHIIKYRDNFVIHANCAYAIADELPWLVIWVNRNLDDVKASMDNIKGDRYKILQNMWNDKPTPKELSMTRQKRLELFAKVIPKIKNYKELEYEDLKQHPLWLDKEDRTNFYWLQTKKDQWL